ncbi:ornithine cyclodeaminase family protein [Anaerococcus porci]|uniref:ornithine cyclodeaminase family protein n=1 Tax=Anaerococcus porci TaxID=2652269 RepID=UPI002A75D06B|nr:ornithine cyclodeaminase family protein [Anaerococcus porci]MDY3006754.1 ornithine cyclodeaminase family protein [Anaerococcus porci]
MVKVKIISDDEVKTIMNGKWLDGLEIIKKSFEYRQNDKIILPEKSSQIFDEDTQNRINCMPSTLLEENVCGVKWVSVFPTNSKINLQTVNGITVISEIETGNPYAIISSSWLTKYRTAGVAALASKYLAKKNNRIIGFIGAGQEARMHFELFKLTHPTIKVCKVSSKTHKSCLNFINEFKDKYKDVEFVTCDDNFEKAIRGSDIIITAISGQQDVLKAKWIDKANFYVHVGGYEDEFDVALKSDKIICDEWNAVKHRGSQTISKMYKAGILKDENIYADLSEIISGKKLGRTDKDRFIYFNSVGMAYEDIMLAKYIYDISENLGKYVEI